MSLEFQTVSTPDYLRITYFGDYTFADLMKQIERIKAAANDAGRDHILIDSRTVSGKMTESEKFFVGSHIAEVFGAKLKAAALVPEGWVTKLGEMAAVNRGARFFVTESEEEALNWLNSGNRETRA